MLLLQQYAAPIPICQVWNQSNLATRKAVFKEGSISARYEQIQPNWPIVCHHRVAWIPCSPVQPIPKRDKCIAAPVHSREEINWHAASLLMLLAAGKVPKCFLSLIILICC